MRLIPKKQNGGTFMSFFADYAAMNPPESSIGEPAKGSSRGSGSSEKGKLTEKDIMSMLGQLDGLPNEMQEIAASLKYMYQEAELFGSDGIDPTQMASLYADNMFRVKMANFNKKEYDKAYKEVEKNDGLNEAAITTGGQVLVYGKEDKKLKPISIEEYKKHPDQYTPPISNSNLLWLRAHSPQMVNDNTVFETISNGIGLNKVDQLIKQRLSSLGSDTSSLEEPVSKKNKEILAGANVLNQLSQSEQAGLGLDGMYKAKIITKTQYNQAMQAINYIFSTLPKNAQALLLLQSPDSDNLVKGVQELIANKVLSQTSSIRDVSLDYQENINVDGSKKDSKSGNKGLLDEDINAAQMFLAGYGNKESFMINPGTNIATVVYTNAMQLVKKDGTNLGANSTLQEASEGQFGGILDWNKVMMGGRKINPANFNQVFISDGMVRKIDFPVDENGNPDLSPVTLEAKKKADAIFKDMGINLDDETSVAANYEKINAVLQQLGLSAAYNSKGELVSGNWATFAIMNGTADERVLSMDSLDDEGDLLREVTDESTINGLLQAIQQSTKQDNIDFDKNDSWWEGHYDRFLEGTIWIPLNSNYHNAMMGSGKEMSGALNLELEERQRKMDAQNQLRMRYQDPGQL